MTWGQSWGVHGGEERGMRQLCFGTECDARMWVVRKWQLRRKDDRFHSFLDKELRGCSDSVV